MTCIIGLEHDGKVYMGCDSMAASGWDMHTTGLRKVFINGEYLIGYTTSFRMGQLIQYADLPECPSDLVLYHQQVLKFLVTQFVPCIRTIFSEAGFSKIENNQEEAGIFLVGLRGFLFRVGSDYQVNWNAQDKFDAVGCGASYALGAMGALHRVEDPVERLTGALTIATHFSNGVCAPYYLEAI